MRYILSRYIQQCVPFFDVVFNNALTSLTLYLTIRYLR